MKKVLLTGASGMIGRNILPYLSERLTVSAPTRCELDLKDESKVDSYVRQGKFDIIINCANPNPAKSHISDTEKNFLSDSLRTYYNLQKVSSHCERFLYLGSGAEYDKRFDIVNIKEEEIGRSIPIDDYGFAKYIMNNSTAKSINIFNLRIFGCYGPYDHESKFITHAIRCCLEKKPITIRQDCYFDYMHVSDLARIIHLFCTYPLKFNNYNVCSGTRISLSDIACKVRDAMNSSSDIVILRNGFNKEYTACNNRLLSELGSFQFTSIDEGIKKQINWEFANEKARC